jgi:hypothetical protein
MCGLAGTELQAGAAWAFYETTRDAIRGAGIRRDNFMSTSRRRAGLSGPGLGSTNSLRHRGYGLPDPRGILHRPIIGTVPRVTSSATRPAGLRDPLGEQRLVALEDSEADDFDWGFGRLDKCAAVQTMQQRYSFEY